MRVPLFSFLPMVLRARSQRSDQLLPSGGQSLPAEITEHLASL